MPNVASVLKQEIARIARKEAKAAVGPLRKPSVRARADIAGLKRRLAALEKANKDLLARLVKVEAAQPVPATEPAARGWISGKGIRSLRKRLGLSQNEFARLAGVSGQAVYMWESKTGTLTLRGPTKAKVFAVRGLGAREARRRLAEMAEAAAKQPARKPVKRPAKRAGSKGRRTAAGRRPL
jgi:DNA-binding transcriptional regulator YiaG